MCAFSLTTYNVIFEPQHILLNNAYFLNTALLVKNLINQCVFYYKYSGVGMNKVTRIQYEYEAFYNNKQQTILEDLKYV